MRFWNPAPPSRTIASQAFIRALAVDRKHCGSSSAVGRSFGLATTLLLMPDPSNGRVRVAIHPTRPTYAASSLEETGTALDSIGSFAFCDSLSENLSIGLFLIRCNRDF